MEPGQADEDEDEGGGGRVIDTRGRAAEPGSRGWETEPGSRGRDAEPGSRGRDAEPGSRGWETEPGGRGWDAEPGDRLPSGVSRSWMVRMLGLVRRLGASADLQETLDRIAEGVVDVLNFGAVAINVVTQSGDLQVAAVTGPPGVSKLLGQLTPRERWDEMLAACEPWGSLRHMPASLGERFNDIESWIPDPSGYTGPDAWDPEEALYAPMRTPDGALLGILSVDSPTSGRRPNVEQRTLLELFAAEAGLAIADAMYRASLSDRETLFRTVFAGAPVPMAILDTDAAVVHANDAFIRLVRCDLRTLTDMPLNRLVHSLDASRVAHACAAIAGRHATELTIEHRLVRTDGTVRWARTSLSRIESIVVGFRLVAKVEDITEGRQALDELRYLADHDLLTGLPNRRRALGRLDMLLNAAHGLDGGKDRHSPGEAGLDGADPVEDDPGGKLVAVLFCDLDGFKAVNDRMGHSAGDQLLVRVAQRLAGVVRPGDLLCRHGGDEFVVVCSSLAQPDTAVAIAQRCIEALDEPFTLDGGAVEVSLCVGIAVAPRSAGSPAELVAAADEALYQAKANGRSRWYLTTVPAA